VTDHEPASLSEQASFPGHIALVGPKDQVADQVWALIEKRVDERSAEIALAVTSVTVMRVSLQLLGAFLGEDTVKEFEGEVTQGMIFEMLAQAQESGYVVEMDALNRLVDSLRKAARGDLKEEIAAQAKESSGDLTERMAAAMKGGA
jgi:hypothetical protein